MKTIGKIMSSSFEYKKYNKSYSLGTKALLNNSNYLKNLKRFYCYLVCNKSGRLTIEQFQAFLRRVTIGLRGKFLKKSRRKFLTNCVEVKTNFFAVVSEKSIGLRMGKGKGSILSKMCPVRNGQVLMVIKSRVGFFFLRSILNKALRKLTANYVKIVYRYKNV